MPNIDGNQFIYFLKNWGTNPIVSGLVLLILGGVLTKLLPAVWKQAVRLSTLIWTKIRGTEANHAFEKVYLDWLIDQHRYLGLLPAQIIARRWGEAQQFVDLEDIYVRVSLYGSNGNDSTTKRQARDRHSWQKQAWYATLAWLIFKLRLRSSAGYKPGDPGLVGQLAMV